jgi:phage baseplate assembly protein W
MAGTINYSFPLRKFRQGFFEGNQDTIRAVREDIKILLMTKKGERVVNGGIGTNIPILLGSLFEQIIPEEMEARIRSEIETALVNFMPEVKLIDLKLYFEDNAGEIGTTVERNQVLIRMKYVLTNANRVTDSVQLTLSP